MLVHRRRREGDRMPGALEGLRIVDLTSGIAGPMATMVLSDHGADVIKVEPPSGDPMRAYEGFRVLEPGQVECRPRSRPARGS